MKIYNQTTPSINPIYTKGKFNTLTDKYQVVETDKIREVLLDNGLQVIGNSFAGVRKGSNKEGFQKHMIAFTSPELETNEGQLQLLLTNSHDGTSSLQFDLGFFRVACANGLISGDTNNSVRIRHTKNALDKADEAVKYLLERIPLVAAEMEAMKQIELTPRDTAKLFYSCASHRLTNNQRLHSIPILRNADYGGSLWVAFNRIQEGLIRGNARIITEQDDGTTKKSKLRAISSISKVKTLNKAIWNEATKYMVA